MAAGLKLPRTAGEKHGQIVMIMPIAVADATAVNDHGAVEQGSVTFSGLLKLRQKVSKLLHVVAIDGSNFIHQRRVVAVVGKTVMAFRYADLAIRAGTALAGKHERGDAGGVRLQ